MPWLIALAILTLTNLCLIELVRVGGGSTVVDASGNYVTRHL
jgi:hypothetical protein